MKKINLKGISEILSEKELKNVMGGSGSEYKCNCTLPSGFRGCLIPTSCGTQCLECTCA